MRKQGARVSIRWGKEREGIVQSFLGVIASLENLMACYVWAWGWQVNLWTGARRPAFKSDLLPSPFPKERENGLIPAPALFYCGLGGRTGQT